MIKCILKSRTPSQTSLELEYEHVEFTAVCSYNILKSVPQEYEWEYKELAAISHECHLYMDNIVISARSTNASGRIF